jgi:hypothetical protein
LCNKGANYIRQNRAKLVQRYSHQATEIAKALGDKNKEVVFVMEPDVNTNIFFTTTLIILKLKKLLKLTSFGNFSPHQVVMVRNKKVDHWMAHI